MTRSLAEGDNFIITVEDGVLVLDVSPRPDRSLEEGAASAADMFSLLPALALEHEAQLTGVAWDLLDAPVPGPRTRGEMEQCIRALSATGLRILVLANHATIKMFFRRVLLAPMPERAALATERSVGLAWCRGRVEDEAVETNPFF